MAQHACPWWLGYTLILPWRRLFHDPSKILSPYVHAGMTAVEPGPGMGYFTLDLARMVGPSGKVVAVDFQPKMLAALRRQVAGAGLAERVETLLCTKGSMNLADLNGKADFVLAFAVVHELPSARSFFTEMFAVLRHGGLLLLAEPRGHVNAAAFQAELDAGREAGFTVNPGMDISRSQTALMEKGG